MNLLDYMGRTLMFVGALGLVLGVAILILDKIPPSDDDE